jgi:hypothetical protein
LWCKADRCNELGKPLARVETRSTFVNSVERLPHSRNLDNTPEERSALHMLARQSKTMGLTVPSIVHTVTAWIHGCEASAASAPHGVRGFSEMRNDDCSHTTFASANVHSTQKRSSKKASPRITTRPSHRRQPSTCQTTPYLLGHSRYTFHHAPPNFCHRQTPAPHITHKTRLGLSRPTYAVHHRRIRERSQEGRCHSP